MCRMRALGRRKSRSTKPQFEFHCTSKKSKRQNARLKSRRPLQTEDRVNDFFCVRFFATARADLPGSLASPDQLNFGVFEVAAEACCVHAMSGEELWADENYRDVVGVTR